MNPFTDLYRSFFSSCAELDYSHFETFITNAWDPSKNGHIPMWNEAFTNLPDLQADKVLLNQDVVTFQCASQIEPEMLIRLEDNLRKFLPWRKGPFNLFGIQIDSEWQSWMKWNRVLPHITPLKGRSVLDIGCGNGYYLLRMLGEGARFAIGIEPYVLSCMQFLIMQKYLKTDSSAVLPLSLEQASDTLGRYDTVFSMGVLYHAKDPVQHLRRLKDFMADNAELIVETIVIDGGPEDILIPDGRYAQMRNVSVVPSSLACEKWIKDAGFESVCVTEAVPTTSEEQRVTDWMRFQSLADYLDPEDCDRTVEGYPAPKRAVFICR